MVNGPRKCPHPQNGPSHPALTIFVMKDRPARVSDPETYGLQHLAFQVSSVEETVRELEEKWIDCEPVRYDFLNGKRMTFFKAPDGLPNEIPVHEH